MTICSKNFGREWPLYPPWLRLWAHPGGWLGWSTHPKTYESNFIRHDFVQFGKQHSRFKAIFPLFFCHSTVV